MRSWVMVSVVIAGTMSCYAPPPKPPSATVRVLGVSDEVRVDCLDCDPSFIQTGHTFEVYVPDDEWATYWWIVIQDPGRPEIATQLPLKPLVAGKMHELSDPYQGYDPERPESIDELNSCTQQMPPMAMREACSSRFSGNLRVVE